MKKIRTLTLVLSIVMTLAVAFPFGVNATPPVDGVRSFHGKWVSIRIKEGVSHPQTLKIKCDAETNYCKMKLVVEESDTCTGVGEPTGALLIGEGVVQVINHTIGFAVDAYCLTKPPTHFDSFDVTFFYNELDDTLTDNIDVPWFPK